MKKLIFLLPIILIFFNCSKNDPVNNPEPVSFLERYDNTVWLADIDEAKTYIRFVNDLDHPIEYWLDGIECFNYLQEDFTQEGVLMENLNNTLKFTYIEDVNEIEYRDEITVTISGSTMVVNYEYYKSGELYESGSIYFTRSFVDVDSLILCNE